MGKIKNTKIAKAFTKISCIRQVLTVKYEDTISRLQINSTQDILELTLKLELEINITHTWQF